MTLKDIFTSDRHNYTTVNRLKITKVDVKSYVVKKGILGTNIVNLKTVDKTNKSIPELKDMLIGAYGHSALLTFSAVPNVIIEYTVDKNNVSTVSVLLDTSEKFDISTLRDIGLTLDYKEIICYGLEDNNPAITTLEISGSYFSEMCTSIQIYAKALPNIEELKVFTSTLEKLRLSLGDLRKVTDLSDAFVATHLAEVDLTGTYFRNVRSTVRMFWNTLLKKVNISGCKFESLEDASEMFVNTDIKEFDMDILGFNLRSIKSIFYNSNLEKLHLSFDRLTKLENAKQAFSNATIRGDIIIENARLDKLTDIVEMFADSLIENVVLKNVYLPNVSDIESIFRHCTELKTVKLIHCDIANINKMDKIFSDCSSLEEIILDDYTKHSLGKKSKTTLASAFNSCEKLENLDLSFLTIVNSCNLSYMAYWCSSLRSLKMPTSVINENIQGLSNTCCLCYGCKSLKKLEMNNFISETADLSSAFSGCEDLEELSLNNWQVPRLMCLALFLAKCSSLVKLSMNNWVTSQRLDIDKMFYECSSLEEIDTNIFDNATITSNDSTFEGCNELKKLDLHDIKLADVSSNLDMQIYSLDLCGCTNLKSVSLPKVDIGRVNINLATLENIKINQGGKTVMLDIKKSIVE